MHMSMFVDSSLEMGLSCILPANKVLFRNYVKKPGQSHTVEEQGNRRGLLDREEQEACYSKDRAQEVFEEAEEACDF